MAELQKSLHTKDLGKARRRCHEATVWFKAGMEALRRMPQPTRADLERAATLFFERLKSDVDQPRRFGSRPLDEALAEQVDLSEARIRELDHQLVTNEYDVTTDRLAADMLTAIHDALPSLDDASALQARSLAARAAREQMLYFLHQLSAPANSYAPRDNMFAAGSAPYAQPTQVPLSPSAGSAAGVSLRSAVQQYLAKKKLRGLGQSQLDEVGRPLGWLQEVIEPDRVLATITKDELRAFRDDLERLDRTFRGRKGPFRARLTNVKASQIKSVTSSRYWKSTQAFFGWSDQEGLIPTDLSTGLKVEKRKGETKGTPEPFTIDEVKAFLSTPLYTGYASERSPTKTGDSHVRGGHWWAGLLPLFTGLRAGELSQLLPGDFVFDAPIPHLKVREEDEGGNRVKSAKNSASIRDVPLASTLLALGLREFVERQAEKYPKDRVFRGFRLGARGRTSDGMTKFWRNYLKRFNLWKPGRATHVARHTVVARLRALEVPAEDIAAFVGHSQGTITSQYGGAYPLERKAKTAEKLDHGFDLLSHVGGPFDAKKHQG